MILAHNNDLIAAADIGGSHITVGFVQNGLPKIIDGYTVRIKLDSKGTQEEILNAWFDAFEQLALKKDRAIGRIAFAMPGPFDYQKGVSLIRGLDKYESLYGENIKSIFARHFKIDETNILFRNDAEAFLHGEVMAAALAADRRILGITLGTGFGSAISQYGDTKDLNLGLAAFKDSIADDFLTTRWFRSAYEKAGRAGLEVQEISYLARRGEPLALKLFDEYTENLTAVLHQFSAELSPDDIIIGGNIAKAQDLFLPRVQKRLELLGIRANFHLALLGEHSAMVGSAYLFKPQTIIK
ncbi:ROK family protein [Sphingobacterium puteale]|uniref:ROK family protein n=1 Tax=Sphingobacterium puteale TaxID=2420510 RepID=A0A420VWE3_9SPHI|nr:ROK family protein [Sphingobacterium puteale]RKO70642.1 ROK family protein [Sphingobacterium puteale]